MLAVPEPTGPSFPQGPTGGTRCGGDSQSRQSGQKRRVSEGRAGVSGDSKYGGLYLNEKEAHGAKAR